MDMLEVNGLSVKVEGQLILKDINFSLKEGASHILFGPNGSGKTTLISTLARRLVITFHTVLVREFIYADSQERDN